MLLAFLGVNGPMGKIAIDLFVRIDLNDGALHSVNLGIYSTSLLVYQGCLR